MFSVLCKLGATADVGGASKEIDNGSKNIDNRLISRTVRAASQQKLERKKKPNKKKKEKKKKPNKTNHPRSSKKGKRKTKIKSDGQKYGKGSKINKMDKKGPKKRRHRKKIEKKKQNNKNKKKVDLKKRRKERKRKQRKLKKLKLKKISDVRESSRSCPDLACINNAGGALKLEKDQIANFIKQKSRVENYISTLSAKLGKKGQFEADAASLKSALGGNLENATCGGSSQRTVSAAAEVSLKTR